MKFAHQPYIRLFTALLKREKNNPYLPIVFSLVIYLRFHHQTLICGKLIFIQCIIVKYIKIYHLKFKIKKIAIALLTNMYIYIYVDITQSFNQLITSI